MAGGKLFLKYSWITFFFLTSKRYTCHHIFDLRMSAGTEHLSQNGSYRTWTAKTQKQIGQGLPRGPARAMAMNE